MILLLLALFYGYWLIGALFGVYFVGWGAAGRLDAEARGLSWGMRLLLWPGSVVLWPLLLRKLLLPKPTETEPTSL